jgi:hypothetical protein
MPMIPANPAMPVNIIPVDVAADAVVRLTFCPEAQGLNFHLTAPLESLPRLGELVKLRGWARLSRMACPPLEPAAAAKTVPTR